MSLSQTVRNIFSNYALAAVTGVIGFVLTPILFHRLRPANFGILTFALGVATILEVLDFGMASSLSRFVSIHATRGQYTELKRLVSTVFYFLAAFGLFSATLLAGLSPYVARLFRVEGTAAAPGHLVLALVGFSVAFQLPAIALRGFLEGFQQFHLANAVSITVHTLQAVATITLLYSGFGLVAIAALFPLAALARLVGLLFVSRLAEWAFSPSWKEISLASLKDVRTFATLAFLTDTVIQLFSQADTFLAARFLTLPDLALLGVARRFPWALPRLAQQGIWVAYPIASAVVARGDNVAREKFVLVSTRHVLSLVLPLAAALFVWAEVILRLWVGAEVLPGVVVFRTLLVFTVFVSLQEIPFTVLYALGRIAFSTGLSVVLLSATVPLGAWACARGGLWGLAMVFAGLQGMATSLLCWHALKLAEIDFRRWFKKGVQPVILALIPALSWFLVSKKVVPPTLAGLALSVVAGLFLFLAVLTRLVTGSRPQTWRGRVRSVLTEIE